MLRHAGGRPSAAGRRRRAVRLGRGRPRHALGPAAAVAGRDARLPGPGARAASSTSWPAGRATCERTSSLLSVFHEDMHGEAFAYTRQTLGYPPAGPGRPARPRSRGRRARCPGDVRVPGGTFLLGPRPGEPFVFDNEKWAHPVELRPFAIARAPVTQAEFAAFVEDGGYARRELWTAAGWRWREPPGPRHPVYWRPDGAGWLRRDFDRVGPARAAPAGHPRQLVRGRGVLPLGRPPPADRGRVGGGRGRPGRPVRAEAPLPVGRRAARPDAGQPRRRRPRAAATWPPARPATAPAGCRQMIGNVWEWTASDFGPTPASCPTRTRSTRSPWFGTHKVLRGGCWPTRAAAAAQHVAELLHAGPPRRVGRLPHVCGGLTSG